MKTKVLLCLILTVSALSVALGQSVQKNTVRISAGTHWPDRGEGAVMESGIALSSEYLRELKKYLFVGVSLHYGTQYEGFKNRIYYSSAGTLPDFLQNKRMRHESVVAGFANLMLAPINTRRSLFLIGGGVGLQYQTESEFWSDSNRFSVASLRQTDLSFNAILGYDYKVSRHVSLGLRQNFLVDGDVRALLTIGAGIRF